MRRDDVNCSGGNGGSRQIGLASRCGEFRHRRCDPLLVAPFHGSNVIASRLIVAGKAVRISRPPNLSAPQLRSDFSCRITRFAERQAANPTRFSQRFQYDTGISVIGLCSHELVVVETCHESQRHRIHGDDDDGPGVWKWQFRIGAEVKTGKTETRIDLLAIRHVLLRIDRELKKVQHLRLRRST